MTTSLGTALLRGIRFLIDTGQIQVGSRTATASNRIAPREPMRWDTEGSEEAAELERIVDTVERYEAKRWPDGEAEGVACNSVYRRLRP